MSSFSSSPSSSPSQSSTTVVINNNNNNNETTLSSYVTNILLPKQPLLHERIRNLKNGKINNNGKCIMYVMLNTLRAHDNPALETSIQLSNALNLPLLVLTILNDKWKHSTERRFNFILEAMKSVSNELKNTQNIPLTINIQCKTKTYKPWHLTLGSRGAAAIVVDEPYTEPYISIANQIKRVVAPSILVDNACILTPQLVRNFRAIDRPYKFMNSTKIQRNKRLQWTLKQNVLKDSLKQKSLELYQKELPFDPVNLNNNTMTIDYILKHLVTGIDYNVCKILTTKGDSKSGYKRWNIFMKKGLKSYDKKRNNVLEHYNFGVSRMSCYLNLGIVSPFKMMKTIFNENVKNEKFFHEFLCFRELSYCYCFYYPNHLILQDILPSWAYNTLGKHTVDERPKIYTLDELKEYKTNDLLWNLCQQSLVETGELHNNLRMPWGKQLLIWTETAEDAYEYMLYLNDHFALDGMAPPSYHGIGWCLGLYDSPKNESKIFGRVRYKSTTSKSKYLNVAKYKQQILMRSSNHGKRKFIGMFFNNNNTRKSNENSGNSGSSIGSDDGDNHTTNNNNVRLKKRKKQDIASFFIQR